MSAPRFAVVERFLIDGEQPVAAPTLEAFWRNPAPFEAERDRMRAQFNASMAGHDARVRAQQEARWAGEAA